MLKCTIFAHLDALSNHGCSAQSGQAVVDAKKKSSIAHNGVSGSIPPHVRWPSNGSRRGFVGFPSYTSIARRFVAASKKYGRKSKITIFASATAVVDICTRVRRAGPCRLLFRRQWSAKPIGRALAIALPRRSIAISVVRIREFES